MNSVEGHELESAATALTGDVTTILTVSDD